MLAWCGSLVEVVEQCCDRADDGRDRTENNPNELIDLFVDSVHSVLHFLHVTNDTLIGLIIRMSMSRSIRLSSLFSSLLLRGVTSLLPVTSATTSLSRGVI